MIFMVTTIQVTENTLKLLKDVKDDIKVASYDEAITTLIVKHIGKSSLAGYLQKYTGKKTRKEILGELRDKNDRF